MPAVSFPESNASETGGFAVLATDAKTQTCRNTEVGPCFVVLVHSRYVIAWYNMTKSIPNQGKYNGNGIA